MQVMFQVFNSWAIRGAERGQDPPMVPTNAYGRQVFPINTGNSQGVVEWKRQGTVLNCYESRCWFLREGMTGGAIEGLQGAGFLFRDLGADHTSWFALWNKLTWTLVLNALFSTNVEWSVICFTKCSKTDKQANTMHLGKSQFIVNSSSN